MNRLMVEEEKEFCQYKNCGKPTTIIYLGKGLCESHWQKIASMKTEKAWKILRIKKSDNEQISSNSNNKKEAVTVVEGSDVQESDQKEPQSA